MSTFGNDLAAGTKMRKSTSSLGERKINMVSKIIEIKSFRMDETLPDFMGKNSMFEEEKDVLFEKQNKSLNKSAHSGSNDSQNPL